MLIATSVDAPHVSVEKGLKRRLIVIPFPRKLDASVKKQRHFTQDELDAVITLAVLEALQIDREGWEPPVGNLEAKKRFLADADPVSWWLEALPDSYDGRLIRDVWDDYNQQEEAEITPRQVWPAGGAVSEVGVSPSWARATESSQETRIALIRALELAVGSRDTLAELSWRISWTWNCAGRCPPGRRRGSW